MSTVPAAIGQLIAAPESHFRWVKGRILTQNSKRTVDGIVDALDWPAKQLLPNTFYMILGDISTRAGFGTPTASGLSNVVQWAWMVPGDDLAANQRGRNRGDRFRINQQMMSEIVNGLFPYFCPKQIGQAFDNGNGGFNNVISDISPPETIWWSLPKFSRAKMDNEQKSGIIYTVATIGLNQFGDTILQ